MKDVQQYYRLFKTLVDYLMGVGQLAKYQSTLWFLQGLLESQSRQFVKHNNINVSNLSIMKFSKLYKEAIQQCEYDDQMIVLKNVDQVSSIDLISVSMKKPFVLDMPIAQAIVLLAVTTIVLLIIRLDAMAM